MTEKERLQKSLIDLDADIKVVEGQLSESRLCPNSSYDIARVWVGRPYILKETLYDLQMRKLDLERQLKELEE